MKILSLKDTASPGRKKSVLALKIWFILADLVALKPIRLFCRIPIFNYFNEIFEIFEKKK